MALMQHDRAHTTLHHTNKSHSFEDFEHENTGVSNDTNETQLDAHYTTQEIHKERGASRTTPMKHDQTHTTPHKRSQKSHYSFDHSNMSSDSPSNAHANWAIAD
jgi:hypothetical protein